MPTDVRAPLRGVHVVEFEGLGPCPYAGLLLASLGARITLIVRPMRTATATRLGGEGDGLLRAGKEIVPLDLKQPQALARARDLLRSADALLEGNRPGAMERLGLGPAECAGLNPRLVYGRMTGWGQDGPLARVAGHDLNFVALTGVLSLGLAAGARPAIPPTVLGDAGGGLSLAFGVVAGVLRARTCGVGCVVDAAVVDAVASLASIALWIRAGGQLDGVEPSPFHDSPFYDVYRCADGRWITLAALEPQFYAELLQRLGLEDVDPAHQYDRAGWPELKRRIAAQISAAPAEYWCGRLEGTDACFAPVLTLAEAAAHPHLRARASYRDCGGGALASGVAPRFLPLR